MENKNKDKKISLKKLIRMIKKQFPLYKQKEWDEKVKKYYEEHKNK